MKKFFLTIALALPLAVMAQSQEQKDPSLPVPQAEENFRVAAELSKHGYANKDALSLIQAARLSKQAGFTNDGKDAKKTSASESSKKDGQVTLDPAKLLADAKEMANNDGVLLALIDDVSNNVRGAVGGPKYHVDAVNAKGTDIYDVTFRAGEIAIVTVVGDGDTDLDLYVYDNNGNLIDSDTDYTDNCVCTWTPRWTGNFRIKIVNRGSVFNRYVIRTN